MNMGVWRPLAEDKVRYVGDAVVVVVAETRALAREAAEKVVVNYEELPAVTEVINAIEPGAPQIHEAAPGNLIYDWVIGEEQLVEEAISDAAHVTEMEISNNRLVPNAMEPRTARAHYDSRAKATTRCGRRRRTRMWRAWC